MTREERQQKLIQVFADTQQFYGENAALADAVTYGRANTRLYGADEYPELPDIPAGRTAEIRLSKNKTFEEAVKLHREFPDQKIAVLNFASATRPGGGVKKGSSAQEESLCRCSTLFPTIDRKWLWQKYYDVNRQANDARYTDACIYSPGVIICKTDESIPQRMPEEDFVTVDVITCAAPNLRRIPSNRMNPNAGKAVKMDDEQLYQLQRQRIRHILHTAAYNKADILVLGAFGCGAFENDPYVVARAFRDALGEFTDRFTVISFAIYCRDSESKNYKAFQEILGDEYGDGVIPVAGVASPYPFDYGTYAGVDNEMRKAAGYPPIEETEKPVSRGEAITRAISEGNDAMAGIYDHPELYEQNEEEFIEVISKRVAAELSQEDREYILAHPDPIDHHFGLGLYIRNSYIHGKKLGFPVLFADDLSGKIVERVIDLLQKE